MLRRGFSAMCGAAGTRGSLSRLAPSSSSSLACKQSISAFMPEDELADLIGNQDREISSSVLSESQWNTPYSQRNSAVFPCPLIETSRSKPMPDKNADRLAYLWSMSSSHGVSWDELDEAFLAFHREYLKAENDWLASHESRFESEYKVCEERLRKTLSGEESQIALTMNRRRGKIRRMTYKRMARLRNKEILQPFGLPQFSAYMKQLVSQRIVKREESERTL